MAGFNIMAGLPFRNLLETIFCSRHDEIEISCPAPALCDGFDSSNAHHPVSLTYAGFHVTHINDCSSRTQFEFDKADYPRLMEHLQRVDRNSVLGSGHVDRSYLNSMAS